MGRSMIKHVVLGFVVLGLFGAGCEAGAGKKAPAKKPAAKSRGADLTIPEVSRDKVICFALYTVNNNILKLTAQFYPLQEGESRKVRLEIKDGRDWKQVAETDIIERGWTAPFRVENWDMTKTVDYRVAHGENAYYTGTIKKDPVKENTIVVAAFTGNSIYPGHGGDIPKNDIVENLKKVKPDLLFFSGDQVYDHKRHYAYWLKFGRDFGDIIRMTP
ncbi:MAG: hypothetical protein ACYS8Z_24520, partial [Planctomycetota bacterium]